MHEDRERQERVIEAMRAADMDAILSGSPTGVLLLTGFWPVMGGSVAILTSSGERHVVLPEDEMDLAQAMSSASLSPYKPARKEKLVIPMEALSGPLADVLRQLGLERARIGAEMERDTQPATYAVATEFRHALLESLHRIAPEATFTPCDTVLKELKAVKTPGELDLLRTATAVAEDGFRAVETILEPGLREMEVAAHVHASFQVSSRAEQLERSYGFFFCMSGPNAALAAAAYARTRQRRLQKGDLVLIHANTCADGFWTDLTRTYTVGPPSPRQERMRAAIMEARSAALEAIHPGARASEVDLAARSVMERHGLAEAFKHPAGHGVGFNAANAHSLPRIHPRSPDILQKGMTFNVEPAAYFTGYGGMRHCDMVAVENSGATVLSNW